MPFILLPWKPSQVPTHHPVPFNPAECQHYGLASTIPVHLPAYCRAPHGRQTCGRLWRQQVAIVIGCKIHCAVTPSRVAPVISPAAWVGKLRTAVEMSWSFVSSTDSVRIGIVAGASGMNPGSVRSLSSLSPRAASMISSLTASDRDRCIRLANAVSTDRSCPSQTKVKRNCFDTENAPYINLLIRT